MKLDRTTNHKMREKKALSGQRNCFRTRYELKIDVQRTETCSLSSS